jgi:hypothetical protein
MWQSCGSTPASYCCCFLDIKVRMHACMCSAAAAVAFTCREQSGIFQAPGQVKAQVRLQQYMTRRSMLCTL